MKNLLLWFLFIFVVMGAIYAIPEILSRTLATDNPLLTVTSQSMWPVLKRGDLIFVKAVDFEDIKAGSVIVFHHGEGMAVHRVVKIEGQTITTKGDANVDEDNPITRDDVVGRVLTMGDRLFKIPFVGNIALWMNPETAVSQEGQPAPEPGSVLTQMGRYVANPLGFSLLVLLPAVLIFSSVFRDVIARLSPKGRRTIRLRKRVERLEKLWGQARVKRALRL